MQQDRFGLSVSTNDARIIDAINHFSEQLLMSGSEGGKVCDAANAHPENVLLNCYATAIFLYAHDESDQIKAKSFLDAAKQALSNADAREKQHYDAVRTWYERGHLTAIEIYNNITREYPRDCVAAKFAEWLYYCMGQKFNAPHFLSMTEAMFPHNKSEPGFLATHSFALELSGRYDEAQKIAEKALAIEKITPWAHHTIAHVLLLKGNTDEGISKLESYQPLWKNTLPPLIGHNTWHLALFYLNNLNKEKCVALFSDDIWGSMPALSLEQLDAISLLWRMEMAGMPQDTLLKDVAAQLGEHVYQQFIPFDNAHYMYALARTGNTEAVEKSMTQIQSYAAKQTGAQHKLWHEIALPLVKGIAAYAQEDYSTANKHFDGLMPDVLKIGGSDAQDDLFLQAMMVSLLRSGQKEKAMQFMRANLSYYQGTALGKCWGA